MRDGHLQAFKRNHLGKGYVERVPGTGKLLDTEHGVNVGVLSTGRFPGDDKPKPIAFPDPETVALRSSSCGSSRRRPTRSDSTDRHACAAAPPGRVRDQDLAGALPARTRT